MRGAFRPSGLLRSYKGFGSFMSESVDVLVERACSEGQKKLAPPFDCEEVKVLQQPKDHFSLDFKSFTFLNHGAFGAALNIGEQRAAQWRRYCEQQPLRYFDRALFPSLVESSRRLSGYLGTNTRHLAPVANATTALDSVINTMVQQSGASKKVVFFDTAYGSVKRMVARHAGQHAVELRVSFPLSSETVLLDSLEEFLCKHAQDTCLGVVDHITSNTAMVMPVQAIGDLFSRYGVPLLVDGAHGPNSVQLELDDISCDFYVGNCHKWMCAPKSVGFLYVRDTDRFKDLMPRVTSHGAQESFPASFYWDGCRDYAAALALPAVLDFWEAYGVQRVIEENRTLADEAVKLLLDTWGTSEYAIFDLNTSIAPMRLVPLPPIKSTATSSDAFRLQEALFHEHGIECPVKCIQGQLHVRISAHIYNELEDYDRLAMAVQKLIPSFSQ